MTRLPRSQCPSESVRHLVCSFLGNLDGPLTWRGIDACFWILVKFSSWFVDNLLSKHSGDAVREYIIQVTLSYS